MTGELSRRAAISFPDEDVLVAARLVAAELLRAARRATRTSCPARATRPNGEDRAWGRRLAKRFGSSRTSTTAAFTVAVKGRKPPCVPVLDASPVKATGGAKIVSLVGDARRDPRARR